MNDTTSAQVFACACIGCRKLPLNLYQGMTDYHLFTEIARNGSYYFTPETRKFFGSRLLGHRVIGEALIVTESKKAGFNAEDGREYRATVWCKFGDIKLVDYRAASSRALNAWLWSDEAAELARSLVAACECHGCQIERAS